MKLARKGLIKQGTVDGKENRLGMKEDGWENGVAGFKGKISKWMEWAKKRPNTGRRK